FPSRIDRPSIRERGPGKKEPTYQGQQNGAPESTAEIVRKERHRNDRETGPQKEDDQNGATRHETSLRRPAACQELAPAETRGDSGQNRLQDMRIVGNA